MSLFGNEQSAGLSLVVELEGQLYLLLQRIESGAMSVVWKAARIHASDVPHSCKRVSDPQAVLSLLRDRKWPGEISYIPSGSRLVALKVARPGYHLSLIHI